MENKTFPKILIISHCALSDGNNMGRMLGNIFSAFPADNLAQLYLHDGLPTLNVCKNYYSFSDADALKSVFCRWKKGKIYKNCDFEKNEQKFFSGAVYKVGKKRKPYISFCRDLVWKLSNVFNKKLYGWIKDFAPDFIFFASGDYSYSYRVALKISQKLSIPLATFCVDDYYLFCKYENEFLGKKYFKNFIKVVHKTIKNSEILFVLNDYMNKEYSELFGKQCFTLYPPCPETVSRADSAYKSGISYIGGLSLGRDVVLAELCRQLKQSGFNSVNVYSAENRSEVLAKLTADNGINFCGALNGKEVIQAIKTNFAVIHVESFDKKERKRTALSLSTKIAESLGSGTLIVAFGPQEIASMRYLKDNRAAIVSDDANEIVSELAQCAADESKYNFYVNNAIDLARKNHDLNNNTALLCKLINDCKKRRTLC